MPLDPLITYLARQFPDLANAQFHRAQVDERTQQLFLYLQSEVPADLPALQGLETEIPLGWEDVFGYAVCTGCYRLAPVEEITACRECGGQVLITETPPPVPNFEWRGASQGNFKRGRGGEKPMAIVIHRINGSLAGYDAWVNTPKKPGQEKASSHYAIGKGGEVHQYVLEADTAYHATVSVHYQGSHWKLFTEGMDPDRVTLGIDHEGAYEEPWPDAMREASVQLCARLCRRWEIPMDRDHIIGHDQVHPIKHQCPGQAADLDQYVGAVAAAAAK
jgi:hypothetical protein